MATHITDSPKPSELVLQMLQQHMPYSVPLLRRLQFLTTSGRCGTPHSHVLSTFDTEAPSKDFLVAYLDFSEGPDTETWVYSSIESASISSNEDLCEEQVLKLLDRIREIEAAFGAKRETPGIVLIGSLHKKVLQILQKLERVQRETEEHTKFLFRVEDLPPGRALSDGLSWSSVREEDIQLILSRTWIPYQASVVLLIRVLASD